jgi:hypothetical protein
VDAWRTPKKIRASHLANQSASLEGDPGGAHGGSAAPFRVEDFQCVAQAPPRPKHIEQPIDGARTRVVLVGNSNSGMSMRSYGCFRLHSALRSSTPFS